MVRTEDLLTKAELFATSAKLVTTFSCLEKMAGGELTDIEKEVLGWAGGMISGVDWDSPHYEKSDFSAVLATTLRPGFYDAFIKMKLLPNRNFLNRLYNTLESKGEKQELSERELVVAKEVLKRMSDYAFEEYREYTPNI
jgi:hypothetical protein